MQGRYDITTGDYVTYIDNELTGQARLRILAEASFLQPNVLTLLVRGGFCEVWRGTDTVLTRPVAVKLLHAGYAHQPEARARFQAEARHAGGLSQADGSVRPDADPEAAAWLLLSVLSAQRLRAAVMPPALEPALTALVLGALAPPAADTTGRGQAHPGAIAGLASAGST